MDYQGLYEDVLDIESRARETGLAELAQECYEFRLDMLLRFYTPIGHYRIS
jgi:hypothetical protein